MTTPFFLIVHLIRARFQSLSSNGFCLQAIFCCGDTTLSKFCSQLGGCLAKPLVYFDNNLHLLFYVSAKVGQLLIFNIFLLNYSHFFLPF